VNNQNKKFNFIHQMTLSALHIKDLKLSKTTVQMPIAEWQKVYRRLAKLEQKEKLIKQFRAGMEDVKKGKVYPIENLLK
jgi:hypothetical protein